MKLIIRETGYAVAALCLLAKDRHKKVAVSELARKMKISRHFLRKIMQLLNKQGVVSSFKGQGGGFLLAKAPNKISLIDLIKLFQGPIKFRECSFKRQLCPNIKNCKLKRKVDNIQQYVLAELKNITLESLLKGK